LVIVAASDASQEWKAQAKHICTGSGDQSVIQTAINESVGGIVELSPGTFKCSGSINLRGGTFKGQGPTATCVIFTNKGRLYSDTNVGQIISDFRVEGSGYASPDWQGVVNIRGANQTLRNVTGWADHTISSLFFVIAHPDVGNPIYNIEFDNCHADYPRTHGFMHSQWFDQEQPYEKTAKTTHVNIRYYNCSAIGCGLYGPRFAPQGSDEKCWICGFDFAELNHIQDLYVSNCRASQNWESGFHFEWVPDKENCVLEDCVSVNNGQKPYPTTAPTLGVTYFGCGYYAARANVTFRRCYAEGNPWYGFYASMGGKLYDCVDVSTGKPTITEAQRQAYRPASFGSVPSRTTNPNLVLSNCASFNSRGYAVHADLATNIQITDLVVVDPVGISGKALCLGCTHNQFATSTVSFKCWGDTVDTFLAINNSDTATFSGFVVTNKPAPIKVTGSGTKNLKIQNVTVYSSSALQGTNGVVVSSEVPGSQVALSNIAKGNVTSAPAKPVATVPGDDETSQLVIVSAVKIEPVQPKVGDVVKVDVTFTNVSGAPGQIVVTSDRPCQIPMPDGSVRYDRATFDVSAMSPGESATWRFWFVPLETGRFNVCFKPVGGE
jgi:hypothetical protein